MALKEGKLYYSISEVSSHFNVAPSLLRYWETEFKEITPKRNARGTRFYKKEDVAIIARVYLLVKEKGFTLQGAKDKLESDKKGVDKNIQVIEKLQDIREFLVRLNAQL